MTAPILYDEVRAAVAALGDVALDRATRALAESYAAQIDADPTLLPKLGPQLLAALEALGLSPRSRAALVSKAGGGGSEQPAGKLHQFRANRARLRAAPDLDA